MAGAVMTCEMGLGCSTWSFRLLWICGAPRPIPKKILPVLRSTAPPVPIATMEVTIGNHQYPELRAASSNALSAGGWEGVSGFQRTATRLAFGTAEINISSPLTLVSNHWVAEHNDGNPPGFKAIVVMDCWEHAFVPDYKATERAKYIDAYFKNLDWRTCEARLIK